MERTQGGSAARGEDRVVVAVLILLVLVHLGQGLHQALAPGSFFELVGPFGERNDHYTRDVASWSLALAGVLVVALRRPRWRVPVLAFVVAQYVLHALNHLKDIGDADPEWLGPFDFFGLALIGALAAWALARAARRPEARA